MLKVSKRSNHDADQTELINRIGYSASSLVWRIIASYASKSSEMRKLQVALCRNRFEPGNNQLCSSLPKVTVDSTFFLVIFSSNYVSPPWFLNKLAKILEYSSDHRQELVIFMAHEIDRSDVRKQIGNYQVESAKQKKSNHNRDEIVHIGETVPSGLMKLEAMHLSKQNAHLPALLSDESVGV